MCQINILWSKRHYRLPGEVVKIIMSVFRLGRRRQSSLVMLGHERNSNYNLCCRLCVFALWDKPDYPINSRTTLATPSLWHHDVCTISVNLLPMSRFYAMSTISFVALTCAVKSAVCAQSYCILCRILWPSSASLCINNPAALIYWMSCHIKYARLQDEVQHLATYI